MTTETEFTELLQTLGPDALAILRDVMTLARDLGPGKSTAFLSEGLAALDAPTADQTPRPASELLAPVLARWAEGVQS